MGETRDFCSSIYRAFKNRKPKTLRKLKDQILNKAVLSFKVELFDLAVYSYVLSKILSKLHFLSSEKEPEMEAIEIDLLELIDAADGSQKEWKNAVSSLKKDISSLEKEDSRYVISLIRKGELKAAATLYAQGISLSLASKLTGIEQQEILDYSGKTMMFDRLKEEKDIFERLKLARKMLGG